MSEFWEEILSFEKSGVLVRKWKSKRTGLTLVLADIESPLVQGYFTIATEAHDDDGCPHTLEHLIFMGSEQYPYKGALDRLANRNLAEGTNAWTAVDHTAYTLKTAGAEGFLNVLPIYMDSILYPTLTYESFVTEVHHINNEGENSGVVYCEMQGVENNAKNIMSKKVSQLLWPGDSGYKSETGGKLANLRKLTIEKIRNYHKAYYRPDKLVIIVTGKVPPIELLSSLNAVEENIVSKGSLPPSPRPWTDPINIAPLLNEVTEKIDFPHDDESVGSLIFSIRGPKYGDFETMLAIDTLTEFLTDGPASTLQSALVETTDPFCADIFSYQEKHQRIAQHVIFTEVQVGKLPFLKEKFLSILNDIESGNLEFDLNRMSTVLHRKKQQLLGRLETNGHETVSDWVISDFLYGQNPSHLESIFSFEAIFDLLITKDKSYWLNLIRIFFLKTTYVCVEGYPSATLAKNLIETEEERTKKQREELGEEKLKELGEILQKAVDVKNNNVPDLSMFTKTPVPDPKKIQYINISTIRNDKDLIPSVQSHLIKEHITAAPYSAPVPFFLQFDHVKSSFVEVTCLLDTDNLTGTLRLYLEIYLEIVTKSPIEVNGELISYEEVINSLERDTVDHYNGVGFGVNSNFRCGALSQYVRMGFKVEKNRYIKGVEWMKNILFNTKFTKKRIIVAVKKLLNDIPPTKADGFKMAGNVLRELSCDRTKSNHSATTLIRQAQFLQFIDSQLQSDDEKIENVIVSNLNELRRILTEPSALHFQVIGDILQIAHPKKPWTEDFLPKNIAVSPYVEKIPVNPRPPISPSAFNGGEHFITPVPALESSFFICSRLGPSSTRTPLITISSIMVLASYLTRMEGPFWGAIRGNGLAYGCDIRSDIDGFLTFHLYRSSNVYKAYIVSCQLIAKHLSGELDFDPVSIEEARSSTIYDIVSKESTASQAAEESIKDYFRGWGHNGWRKILADTQKITIDDLKNVLVNEIGPLFDGTKTNSAVAVNPQVSEETRKEFEADLPKIQVIANLEEFFSLPKEFSLSSN